MQAVREKVTKLADQGLDVTVAMHSAGGSISPEGLKGLLSPDRAKEDKAGGVTSLAYITAPVLGIGDAAPGAAFFDIQARNP